MWMDNEERGLGPDTGFYFKWNIDSDGKPRGCPGFPSGWKDGHFRHHGWLEPRCPKQDADDGTGQELWKTVEDFADDNELWTREFVASFEKMQTNGYSQLDQGPTGFWKHFQTEVKYDNVIQEIPKWGAQFRVSAYITVKKHTSLNWGNIFHFTKGGGGAQYGDRIPAMWARKDGYFMISSAVSGNKNHKYEFAYELGKQHHVVIQQHQKTDGKVMYEIIIDGLLMYAIENTLPKDFANVKVYLSSKWNQPFDGLVEDFEFTANPSDWSDVLITPNQPPKCKATFFKYKQFCRLFVHFLILGVNVTGKVELGKGKLVQYYPTWGPEFSIEMDITIKALPSKFNSILHFSENFSGKNYGDRVPAIWLSKSGFVLICSAISGNKNKCTQVNQAIGQQFTLGIKQATRQSDGKMFYEISVDGNIVFSIENTQPMSFTNVKAYGGDPWFDSPINPELVEVSDLKLCNLSQNM